MSVITVITIGNFGTRVNVDIDAVRIRACERECGTDRGDEQIDSDMKIRITTIDDVRVLRELESSEPQFTCRHSDSFDLIATFDVRDLSLIGIFPY